MRAGLRQPGVAVIDSPADGPQYRFLTTPESRETTKAAFQSPIHPSHSVSSPEAAHVLDQPSSPFRLRTIQCLRAVAALTVLLQHAVYFAGQSEGSDVTGFERYSIGVTGVFLFFMISGFVMAMQTGQSASRFALHRILRIYPGYLLALSLSALLVALFLPGKLLDLTFDVSLLLVPTGSLSDGFQVPYWTLIYEMLFYFLLFLMISLQFRPAWYGTFMVIWTLVILVAPLLGITNPAWALADAADIFLSPFNLFFIGGFLLFGAIKEGRRFTLAVWLLLVLADSLDAGGVVSQFYVEVVVIGGALLCLAAWLPDLPCPRFLVRLGDGSYGLYLAHAPIMRILFDSVAGRGHGFWFAFAVFFSMGLAGGCLFGLFEFRLYRDYMRPLADRWSRRLLPRAA